MAQATMLPEREQEAEANDYVVEQEAERPTPPIGTQVVRAVRIILVLVIAAISLALFWVFWTALGLI